MACRIHWVWASTSVSPKKSLVSGGNGQHVMEHCPGSPSPSPPTAARHRGVTEKRKRITEEELRERERGGLDKMNYAKLSEAAIVGGAGCVKGIQR